MLIMISHSQWYTGTTGQKERNTWFRAFANFHTVNTLTISNYRLDVTEYGVGKDLRNCLQELLGAGLITPLSQFILNCEVCFFSSPRSSAVLIPPSVTAHPHPHLCAGVFPHSFSGTAFPSRKVLIQLVTPPRDFCALLIKRKWWKEEACRECIFLSSLCLT